jgi:hypothetical protein
MKHIGGGSSHPLEGPQMPVPGSQVPGVVQPGSGMQTTGFDPMQLPPMHASLCVQAFPSPQLVPSGALGFEHVPLAGLQEPATWHWSLAWQTTGLLPVQVPD